MKLSFESSALVLCKKNWDFSLFREMTTGWKKNHWVCAPEIMSTHFFLGFQKIRKLQNLCQEIPVIVFFFFFFPLFPQRCARAWIPGKKRKMLLFWQILFCTAASLECVCTSSCNSSNLIPAPAPGWFIAALFWFLLKKKSFSAILIVTHNCKSLTSLKYISKFSWLIHYVCDRQTFYFSIAQNNIYHF